MCGAAAHPMSMDSRRYPQVRPLDDEPAVWLVESESATRYLLDARGLGPLMARLGTPESHSRSWRDGQWQKLYRLFAGPVLVDAHGERVAEPGDVVIPWLLRVGSRHRWDTPDEWWVGRVCTRLTRLDDDELDAILTDRHGN